ncbi:MAG: hypothetical protein ACYDCC_16345 [Actinomycetota bacterium]
MRKFALIVLVLSSFVMHAESATLPRADVNVGDIIHVFIDICSQCTAAATYHVSSSSIIPSTPSASVQSFNDYGGMLVQIKGGPFEYSSHYIDGRDFDTAQSSGWVRDASIDFTGHVSMISVSSGCYTGGCYSIGEFQGDGVSSFNDPPPVMTPTIP